MALTLEPPETQYARASDGGHIAYQVVGQGSLDLVFVPLGVNHVEAAWEVPFYSRVFERLAAFSRLIRLDHRGSGLSDPLERVESPTIADRAEDIVTVLDAVGSDQAAVLANGAGGLVSMFFAGTYPTRTASLVLDGCYARLAKAPDYPFGVPGHVLDRAIERVAQARTEGDTIEFAGLRYQAPTAWEDPEFVDHWRRYHRHTAPPAGALQETRIATYSDVRELLPSIQAPTLVLYRRDDQFSGRPHAEYLAARIAGARLVEVPGRDNLIFSGDCDADLDEIEEFLTGVRRGAVTQRVLATVLFTDMVGSTKHAAAVGDRRWRELLDAHDRAVRRQLERYRGREIDTAGDGFLATFESPGRAIECGLAITRAVRSLGVEVRAGLHTGEVEVRGDQIAGLAVHIGARVAGSAGPGEVVVSSAVPPLVVGSGIQFEDRGDHELKGVPGTWKLFTVRDDAGP